ncbi:uncharacterized protein BP5553_10026 [Venustampulla echinocandica]|uniref:Uncharacterized protein n=1 Tax=Venustampulla echinocandica TaxID=2656787 RepID=A0A370TA77_9HELO|nr:uncharacterized protein BP5553_10026 [Venustampulla echinocandica]RDL30681.1 hypothetical protein BP5553_10026 [Venustampulla echinocandica]
MNTKPTTNTATTRNIRHHDRNFQQNLVDGSVYPNRYEYPDGRIPAKPNNWQEVNQRLAQRRPSLSLSKFSEEAYEQFARADEHASKEKQVMELAIPIIEVRTELSDHIIPSTQQDLPISPNFFLAAKGPDGSLAVARRQACYDGALGARGMYSLQSYGQDKPTYDNNASTITSIYHGGTLKMYTSHLAQSNGPGRQPEYYMHQLGTWGMTGSRGACVDGVRAFRNARDWAREQRDEAIKLANERANDRPPTDPTLASSFTPEVSSLVATTSLGTAGESQSQESLAMHQQPETSTDELAMDINLPANRSSRSQQSHRRNRTTGEASTRRSSLATWARQNEQ